MFLQFNFEPCPKGTRANCHFKLKCFDQCASRCILRDIQKPSHKDFACQFSQEIAWVETNGHIAINPESENSPIRSAANACENDSPTDKISRRINLILAWIEQIWRSLTSWPKPAHQVCKALIFEEFYM